MDVTSPAFKKEARRAIGDPRLQQALGNIKTGFVQKRAAAVEALPEFDALRDNARDIKNHTLAHLDLYLEAYEEKVTEAGGKVHYAETASQACDLIQDICFAAGARVVTKSKSMVSEEIGLNEHLEASGVEVVETDLGEHIIQIRHDTPSHIIAPVIHVTKDQVAADFRSAHTQLPADRDLSQSEALLAEARAVLRDSFLAADVGITGANFLVAETGTSVIVTNEGNGGLTLALPRVHVVLATIEKITPTLEDVSQILRLLSRSATGQDLTVYTSFTTGPRRAEDLDGPEEYHVVILDNGRSGMIGSQFQDMLRCIRCGACMNHCPVYQAVGGHAYGWVYSGPMGAVLTPSLVGVEKTGHLPNASSFCGRCEAVCPMHIPLPNMMRHWREREFERHLTPVTYRWGLGFWAFFAARPRLYQFVTRMAARVLGNLGARKGRFRRLPLAGGWTDFRDVPAPEGQTFHEAWARRRKAT